MSERGFLLDDIVWSQEKAVVAPGAVITVETMLFAINTQQKVSATRFVTDAEKNSTLEIQILRTVTCDFRWFHAVWPSGVAVSLLPRLATAC